MGVRIQISEEKKSKERITVNKRKVTLSEPIKSSELLLLEQNLPGIKEAVIKTAEDAEKANA